MAMALPFLTFLLLPFLSSSLTPPTNTTLLQKTCKATADYDFCVASFFFSPLTPNATDTVFLSSIAIGLAVSNATNTSFFALSQSKVAKSPSLSKIFGGCADKYAFARDALQSSLAVVADERYVDASVQVGAAAKYPNVCRALFGNADGYPKEMGVREVELKKLCAVASDIISLLIADN